MKDIFVSTIDIRYQSVSAALREKLEAVSGLCVNCDLCQKECIFLQRYGKPKDMADQYDPRRNEDLAIPFECSLCGLCGALCPAGIVPAALFLEMRREAVRQGGGVFREHAALKGFERRGTSRMFSYYGLPESCDTVFFPGCTLSGTRSEKVILAYQRLKGSIPSLGIVLDCCTKPSHDLGQEDRFKAMFSEMQDYLLGQGVRRVLVACPGCHAMFAQYGNGLETKSIYEVLAKDRFGRSGRPVDTVTIHDPCAVRFEVPVHRSVRNLVQKQGFKIEEMPHSGSRTLCCGDGGGAGLIAPNLADAWGNLRQREVDGRQTITYCAGCASVLSKLVPTTHVLDMLFEGEPSSRRARVAKPPLTYWRRLKLKKWFKDHVQAARTRERT
jgi:Fe-S oxidoreductase